MKRYREKLDNKQSYFMKVEELDSLNSDPYPKLAEAFYNIYTSGAIDMLINANEKLIEKSAEILGERMRDVKKVHQILRMEIIAKFCHYAECLAALSIAFSYTYENHQHEIVGTYNSFARYKVNQCLDFYRNISTRDVEAIAKILGYPPIKMQTISDGKDIIISSNAAREYINEIGNYYLQLFEIYDAYKHGYRILFGTDVATGHDAFVYFDIHAKQKRVVIDEKDMKELKRVAEICRIMIETIFKNHRERVRFEQLGQTDVVVNMALVRPKGQPYPKSEGRSLRFMSRGDIGASEKAAGLIIYEQFKDELERDHKGKLTAIDLDSRRVVAYDYDIQKLMEKVRESDSSSRIYIRRIGKDDRVNIKYY